MKALSVVVTAALLAGCGSTVSAGQQASAPGEAPPVGTGPWLMECAARGRLPGRCTSRVPTARRYNGLPATPPPRPDVRADGDDEERVRPATASALSELASHDFDHGAWERAIPQLERVARGEAADDPPIRQVAEYKLAIALKNAGDTAAAADLFAAMSVLEDHEKRDDAILWSVQLLQIGCVTPSLLRAVAEAPGSHLQYFDNPQHREQMAFADYARGRALYEQHRDEEARAAFRSVAAHPGLGPAARRCLAAIDGADAGSHPPR